MGAEICGRVEYPIVEANGLEIGAALISQTRLEVKCQQRMFRVCGAYGVTAARRRLIRSTAFSSEKNHEVFQEAGDPQWRAQNPER